MADTALLSLSLSLTRIPSLSVSLSSQGNNYPENGYSTATVLWVETLMTFMFVFVILVLSKKGGVSGANAALGIGFTFAWVLLFMA